jgi:hypothetical protein
MAAGKQGRSLKRCILGRRPRRFGRSGIASWPRRGFLRISHFRATYGVGGSHSLISPIFQTATGLTGWGSLRRCRDGQTGSPTKPSGMLCSGWVGVVSSLRRRRVQAILCCACSERDWRFTVRRPRRRHRGWSARQLSRRVSGPDYTRPQSHTMRRKIVSLDGLSLGLP